MTRWRVLGTGQRPTINSSRRLSGYHSEPPLVLPLNALGKSALQWESAVSWLIPDASMEPCDILASAPFPAFKGGGSLGGGSVGYNRAG